MAECSETALQLVRHCDYLLGVTLQATKKLAASIQPSVNGRGGMHSKPSSKVKRNEVSDARRLELLLQVHSLLTSIVWVSARTVLSSCCCPDVLSAFL